MQRVNVHELSVHYNGGGRCSLTDHSVEAPSLLGVLVECGCSQPPLGTDILVHQSKDNGRKGSEDLCACVCVCVCVCVHAFVRHTESGGRGKMGGRGGRGGGGGKGGRRRINGDCQA